MMAAGPQPSAGEPPTSREPEQAKSYSFADVMSDINLSSLVTLLGIDGKADEGVVHIAKSSAAASVEIAEKLSDRDVDGLKDNVVDAAGDTADTVDFIKEAIDSVLVSVEALIKAVTSSELRVNMEALSESVGVMSTHLRENYGKGQGRAK